MKLTRYILWTVLSMLVAVLIGCSKSGSGSSGSVVPGSLQFVPNWTANIVVGDTYPVTVDLVGSSGVVGQEVTLTVADTSVADIAIPVSGKCYLSSGSISASECTVQLRALTPGQTTTLTASSPGYDTQTLNITTAASGTVNYGYLSVLNGSTDGAQYVTTSPVSLTYPSGGSRLNVSSKLLGSSGVTGNTTITFTPATGTATPASCSVTTSNPICNTTITGLPTTAGTTTAIQVTAVSTQGSGHTYNTMTVNASASGSATSNGQIVFETHSGQQNGSLPNGMMGPLFMWAAGSGKTDTVTVNLVVTNADGSPWTSASPVSLYYYPSTNNTQPTYVGATPAGAAADHGRIPACTLTFNTDGKFYSCGYGIAATQNSGSVIITPTYTSANGYTYTAEPITVTAIANDTYSRTTTFTNNLATDTVWLGVQTGTANAYVSPSYVAVQSGVANPGYCGFNSPNQSFSAACPTGSRCMQGGAYPGASTAYQCYWDPGTVTGSGAATFAITSGNPLTHKINAHSYSPGSQKALDSNQTPGAFNPSATAQWSANAIWSGNYMIRTGCDTSTGVCVVGSCPNSGGSNPMACQPGVNFTNSMTLMEPTYQRYDTTRTMMDAYDVSIIAGANVTASFGPNPSMLANLQTTTVNGQANSSAYYCGTPGASLGQRYGVLNASYNNFNASQGLTQLPRNNWAAMAPTTTSFPPGVSVGTNALAQSNYRLVSGGSQSSCSSGTGCATGESCGLTMANINAGAYSTLTCGKPYGWVSANQFSVLNSTSLHPNLFPSTNPTYWIDSNSNTVLNYQVCSGNTFSANNAGSPLINACGGVVWGNVGSPGQQASLPPIQDNFKLVTPASAQSIINASSPVVSASSNWLNYVLPTIQWLKAACPTCYTFPYDDPSTSFSCAVNPAQSPRDYIEYQINLGDLPL